MKKANAPAPADVQVLLPAAMMNGKAVVDSREVARMLGRPHKNLLADIHRYISAMERRKADGLNFQPVARDFQLVDFFVPSTYTNDHNQTFPCYLLTQKGCEMVANKLTGEKGILFTAAYVNAFHALQEQEGIEGRNRRACVAQENRADIGDERRRADRIREGHAMVARIRISNRRIMPARLPVELAGIDNDAAERRAVTADELRRGMHNDVRAVLNRANQVGRAERVVNHQRQIVPMGDCRNCVDVGNIAVRVAEGFQINRAGVALNGILDLGEVVRIHERRGDAEMRQ